MIFSVFKCFFFTEIRKKLYIKYQSCPKSAKIKSIYLTYYSNDKYLLKSKTQSFNITLAAPLVP